MAYIQLVPNASLHKKFEYQQELRELNEVAKKYKAKPVKGYKEGRYFYVQEVSDEDAITLRLIDNRFCDYTKQMKRDIDVQTTIKKMKSGEITEDEYYKQIAALVF